MTRESDTECMLRAIGLARLGGGWVNPNPQVGCVIVRDQPSTSTYSEDPEVPVRIIGEGYHHAFGKPHAEREALADCYARGEDPEGATVYVTLEPCAHHGKTPPCADALVEARVGRVVVGSSDPNPLVAGKGVAKLEEAGIDVVTGFMREECDALNEPFFHHIRTGMPLVVAKYAMTLDGRIATVTGKSRWITGKAARERVHEDRSRYAAIMVGVGTVIADDPMLNVRLGGDPHQPTRVVVDSRLRTPIDSRLVLTACDQPTVIVTTNAEPAAQRPYLEHGCEVIVVGGKALEEGATSGDDARVDLRKALEALGERGVDSVILEGGRTLLDAAFDEGVVDKVQAYVAPKVFAGVDEPDDATRLSNVSMTMVGEDVLVQGDCRHPTG